MRCDQFRVWVAVLLAASVVLASGMAMGDDTKAPTKATAKADDWHKGLKLAPTERETYRLCAGTSVTLDAAAVAEVQSRILMPTAIDGLDSFAYAAQLTSGRVDINVNARQKPAAGVLIYGPKRTTVLARGGHVAIVVTPTGMAVGLYDGKEASVGIGATWKHITAGHMMTISTAAPQGVESKLPVAPTHVVVDRPALALEGAGTASRATWDPVPGATRYSLTLLNTETKVQRKLEATEPSIAFRNLEPGRYEVRVAALEGMGLDGPVSEPAYVNVVGIELPPGAFASQGKVYLESLQQVTLTHVDGLESTYDNAPVYFQAARHAGLRGKQSTTLYLRLPGANERTPVELLPRALHTEVAISPALARWPRDKVVIRMQLPKMLSEAHAVELVPSVTVNNQAVVLAWTRTGESLESVIPTPPNYPGPWVLRAEVRDQHGTVLGRNFLEIASTVGLDEDDIPREIHRGPAHSQAKR